MTPKEKAKELIEKFIPMFSYWDYYNDCSRDKNIVIKDSKRCALIAVNEILDLIEDNDIDVWDYNIFKYWAEVLSEIEKL